MERGDLSDGLIVDAVRIRLLEIGEAVKALERAVSALLDALPADEPPGAESPLPI
jgi:uncharacterized protein with HEPN domain